MDLWLLLSMLENLHQADNMLTLRLSCQGPVLGWLIGFIWRTLTKKTWKSTLWCQPIFKHIIKAKWIISPNRDENKKYLSCHHLELIHQLHQSKHRWPLPPNPEAVSWQSIAFYLRGMVHLVVQCKKKQGPKPQVNIWPTQAVYQYLTSSGDFVQPICPSH